MTELMIPRAVPGMTKECGPEYWTAILNAQKSAKAMVKKRPGAPDRKNRNKPQDFAVAINKSTGEVSYDAHPMWWFASVEDFLEEQRRVCHENGLVVVQYGSLFAGDDKHFGARITGLRSGFLVVHAATGQGGVIPFEVPIKMGDNADRGAQNAYNWAESYFLRSFLRIMRVDDPAQQVDLLGVAHEHFDLSAGNGQAAADSPAPEPEGLRLQDGAMALCSACHQQQFMSASGPTCPNGHAGAQWVHPSQIQQQQVPPRHQAPQAPQQHMFQGQQQAPQQQQQAPHQQHHQQQGQPFQGQAQHGPPPGASGGQPQSAGPVHGQGGAHGGAPAQAPQQQPQLPQQPAQPHGGYGAPAPNNSPQHSANVIDGMQQSLDATLITPEQMQQELAPAPPQHDWIALLVTRGWSEDEAMTLAAHDPAAPINDALKQKVTGWALAHFNGDKAALVNAWQGTGFIPQTNLPKAQRANPTGLAMLKYLTEKIQRNPNSAAAATA